MGKLNVNLLRYLNPEHFRTLTSIEIGMRNHEYVPIELCLSLAQLKSGGGHKVLQDLTKNGLVAYEAQGKYGMSYRLTTAGYDYLALHVFAQRDVVKTFGNQIGVGKESDIYTVENDDGYTMCLKLHRLGRTSFRQVKNKRDYHKNRSFISWLYLSRLSATKEFAFLKALHERSFPVPEPMDFNRHAVLMQLIKGTSLSKVKQLRNPSRLYRSCMDVIRRLAECGLIHGDFNEFNLLVSNRDDESDDEEEEEEEDDSECQDNAEQDSGDSDEEEEDDDEKLWVIDFPQMVSTSHANAKWYFDRDVECIVSFFKRRFNYSSDENPQFEDIVKKEDVDVVVAASGYIKKNKDRASKCDEEVISEMLESASLLEPHCSEGASKNRNDEEDEEAESDAEKREDEDASDDCGESDSDETIQNGSEDGKKPKIKGDSVESQIRKTIKGELERLKLKGLRQRCRKKEEKRARTKARGKKENVSTVLKQMLDD